MIRNERGFNMIELMIYTALVALLAATAVTGIRGSRLTILAQSVRSPAMLLLQAEQENGKFPSAVTITDLVNHGAPVSDWTINSYARTGTPTGYDYEMEIKAPDTTTIFCLTMLTLTNAECP